MHGQVFVKWTLNMKEKKLTEILPDFLLHLSMLSELQGTVLH